jgi:hypothetical protein
MVSFFFQTFWMYMLAGLGEKSHNYPTEKNTVVAAFMLFGVFYNVSSTKPKSYLTVEPF